MLKSCFFLVICVISLLQINAQTPLKSANSIYETANLNVGDSFVHKLISIYNYTEGKDSFTVKLKTKVTKVLNNEIYLTQVQKPIQLNTANKIQNVICQFLANNPLEYTISSTGSFLKILNLTMLLTKFEKNKVPLLNNQDGLLTDLNFNPTDSNVLKNYLLETVSFFHYPFSIENLEVGNSIKTTKYMPNSSGEVNLLANSNITVDQEYSPKIINFNEITQIDTGEIIKLKNFTIDKLIDLAKKSGEKLKTEEATQIKKEFIANVDFDIKQELIGDYNITNKFPTRIMYQSKQNMVGNSKMDMLFVLDEKKITITQIN